MEFINKIFNLLFSKGGSLSKKIFRGGAWLSLGSAATNILGLIKMAVLARILSPQDFGLMGIGLVSLRWMEAFTESGFNAALIHKKGDIESYLHTAWVIQILRGTFVALILILGGGIIADWAFSRPDADLIIQSVAAVVILRALQNPAVVILKKDLDLRSEFYWRLSGSVCGVATGIILGIALKNVWALVGSVIASQAAVTISSFVVYPFRPRLQLSMKKLKELHGYGRSIFFSNLFVFFREYTDSVLVVKLCGVEALGFYQMARQFSYDPSAQVGLMIRGVMFPAFSSLNDFSVINKAFLKTFKWVAATVIPIGILASHFPGLFVSFFMGSKWIAVTPTFSLLIWAAVFVILNGVSYSCLAGMGKPNLAAVSNALNLLGLSLFLIPQIKALQGYGMALVVMVSLLLSTLLQYGMTLKILKMPFREFSKSLPIVFWCSLPFVVLAICLNYLQESFRYALIPVACIIYFITILFAAKKEFKQG